MSYDASGLQKICARSIVQSTMDQDRNQAKLGCLNNQLLDYLMMRIKPFAIVLAFNTQPALSVTKLNKISFTYRGIIPNRLRRLNLYKTPLNFWYIKPETSLIQMARVGVMRHVQTFIGDNF